MATSKMSLTALARGGRATADDVAAAIPPPQRRWRTRVAVPAVLLLTVTALLVYSARDVLLPATDVRVVPVIVKSGVAGGPAPIVQAPGWFEADPFMVAVSTLAGGVVREVLVLEGEPVTAGQVVARLVDDDARLQLARAAAEVAARAAALEAAAAALAEAERNWEHPIELNRAVATAEAKVAQQEGTLTQWPSQLAAATARLAELRAEHQRVQDLYRMGQAGEIEAIRAEQQYEAQAAQARLERRSRSSSGSRTSSPPSSPSCRPSWPPPARTCPCASPTAARWPRPVPTANAPRPSSTTPAPSATRPPCGWSAWRCVHRPTASCRCGSLTRAPS